MDGFNNEIRIALVGKTGTGKSSTGNTILNRMEFRANNQFLAVTDKSAFGTRTLHKKKLVVIDTPGILDTHHDIEDMKKEIVKIIGLSLPGPHAVLYVMRIGDRLTNDDHNCIRTFTDMFGEEIFGNVILVFTKGNDLEGKSLTEYVKNSTPLFQNLLSKCSNRMIVFENNGTDCEKNKAVENLLGMIDGKTYYSSDMLKRAQAAFMERMENIEQVDKVRREIENEGETFNFFVSLGLLSTSVAFLSGIMIAGPIVLATKVGSSVVAAANVVGSVVGVAKVLVSDPTVKAKKDEDEKDAKCSIL